MIDGAWFEARRGAIQRIDMLLKEVIGNHKKEAEGMKKDTDMKTKMNKATIQALHKSIAHWNDICYGMEDDYFADNCALCEKYRDGSRCGDCPIDQQMIDCNRSGSEWNDYYEANNAKRRFCTVDSADAAEAMLELLVSLLPDDEVRRYDCFAGTVINRGEWSFNYYSDIAAGTVPSTGITTDGRNAFPQAKYVWEKVFRSQTDTYQKFFGLKSAKNYFDWTWPIIDKCHQMVEPIPEMPSYKWAECPTKRWISTTKDGKCVTCGQVVKKKVTKYKAVCKSHPDADVRISCEYYESEEDFNRRCDLTLFVSLIKETAKEFDA